MKYSYFEVIDSQGMHFGRKCLSERSCRTAFDKAHKTTAKTVKSCDASRYALLQIAERVMTNRKIK